MSGSKGLESARPRLADHVRARRHVVDGERFVVLTDGALTLRIGEREWRLLHAMDGTRDLAGISLAAGPARLAELSGFVARLTDLGFLTERRADAAPEPSFARDLPLRVLPGARFRCDGRGHCCARYETVLFTPLERARARAAAPEVQDGGPRPARAFLPAYGGDETLGAVTLVEGRCAYLDPESRRCRIHSVRPHGCRTFPEAYLDVGDAIRVSLRPECACVMAWEGPPLEVPERGSELPRAQHVPRLPPRIALGDREVVTSEYLAWLDGLAEGDVDAAYAATMEEPARVRLRRAEGEVRQRLAEQAYRGATDFTRWALEAVARALGRPEGPADHEAEARFLRAALFVLYPTPSAEEAVRRLALCALVARRFSVEDRAAGSPLAAVAGLLRDPGLTLGDPERAAPTRPRPGRPDGR